MGYQSIEAELEGLPGHYRPPKGRCWLAYDDAGGAGDSDDAGGAVGCVALRPMSDEDVCELKRLYVRPAYRGEGIGRALTIQAIGEARSLGYRLMRLDTGTFLDASRRLYASLGFVERGPYYEVLARRAASHRLHGAALGVGAACERRRSDMRRRRPDGL